MKVSLPHIQQEKYFTVTNQRFKKPKTKRRHDSHGTTREQTADFPRHSRQNVSQTVNNVTDASASSDQEPFCVAHGTNLPTSASSFFSEESTSASNLSLCSLHQLSLQNHLPRPLYSLKMQSRHYRQKRKKKKKSQTQDHTKKSWIYTCHKIKLMSKNIWGKVFASIPLW